MKAIVTGASSGIGLAIARYLLEEGYVVFGIGRDFNDGEKLFQKENFKKIVLDLNDIEESEKTIKEISKKHEIDLLVNNAGIGYYGLHEEISSKKIDELVRINLTIPMVAIVVPNIPKLLVILSITPSYLLAISLISLLLKLIICVITCATIYLQSSSV